jgi:hypothetical protein
MRICRICRFETELDDAVLNLPSGACICLRCYTRETGSGRLMPAHLRHALTATLAEAETALAAAAAEQP